MSVVGCGRVGSELAEQLSRTGHNVTIIDKDARAFSSLGLGFNGARIEGVGFDEDVLRDAGIENADVLAAVTAEDSVNLMTAQVARKLFGVDHVIARLYHPHRASTYSKLGFDYVAGTTLVASEIKAKILAGHGHYLDTFGDIELVDFVLREEYDGETVGRLEREGDGDLRVVAVARGSQTTIPTVDSVLHAGDVLLVGVEAEAVGLITRYAEE